MVVVGSVEELKILNLIIYYKMGWYLNFSVVSAEKVSALGLLTMFGAGVDRNSQFCYLRGPSVNFVPSLVPAVEDPWRG